jgi:hypothetical protein
VTGLLPVLLPPGSVPARSLGHMLDSLSQLWTRSSNLGDEAETDTSELVSGSALPGPVASLYSGGESPRRSEPFAKCCRDNNVERRRSVKRPGTNSFASDSASCQINASEQLCESGFVTETVEKRHPEFGDSHKRAAPQLIRATPARTTDSDPWPSPLPKAPRRSGAPGTR